MLTKASSLPCDYQTWGINDQDHNIFGKKQTRILWALLYHWLLCITALFFLFCLQAAWCCIFYQYLSSVMWRFPFTGIPRPAVWLRNGSSRSLSWPGHAVPRPRATALGIFAFLHGPQDAASAVQHGPVSCRIRKPRPILQGETAMAYLQFNHSRIHLERFWQWSFRKRLVSLCSQRYQMS